MKLTKEIIKDMGFLYQCKWGEGFQLYYNSKTNEYASVNVLNGETEVFKSEEE